MGLYDNFALPSNGQYISTYAGVPIQETAALGETLTKAYDRGIQGVTAFTAMRDNVQVLDADEGFKNKVFDDSQKQLSDFAKDGDYENASPAVMKAVQQVSGNKNLRGAKSAYEAAEKFKASLDKRYESGKIEKWQYDNALSGLSGYKGIASGDNISSHMRQPSAPVDLRKVMQDAAKAVRPETTEGKPRWISKLGKYGITTTKTYDPNELNAAMATAIGNPESQNYISEMREVYGNDTVDNMIKEYAGSVTASMHNLDPSTSYQTPSKYSGRVPGGEGDGNTGGGSYNVAPVGKIEGVDYVDVGKDLNVDLNRRKPGDDASIVNNRTFEERAAMAKENDKAFGNGWIGSVFKSMDNYLKDLPSDEDIKEYEKLSDAAQDYSGTSEEEWNGMSAQERENSVINYVEGVGRRQQELHIIPTDVSAEIDSGILPPRAKNWSNVEKGVHIAKDIQVNHSSRVIYDLNSQEVVETGNDKDLNKAFSGEKGYSFTVAGEADSRNNFGFSSSNESLANSYVMRVTTPDGTKDYLVSKDEGYQRDESNSMKAYYDKGNGSTIRPVTNREFESTVSEIYNTFPAPSYTSTYESENGVSLVGKRNKYNEDTISISDLSMKGVSIPLQDIANQLGFPGVQYDSNTGELNGLTDEMVTQIVFSIGLNKGFYK